MRILQVMAPLGPRSEMQTREYEISDLDQAYVANGEFGEFAGEYVQLSPGKLGFRACELIGDRFILRTYRIGQTVHCRDAMASGNFLTAILLDSPRPGLWNGRETVPGDCVEFQPNVENDYVVPAGAEVIEISVPAPYAESCGWKKGNDAVTQIPPAKLGALQAASRDWLQGRNLGLSEEPMCRKATLAAQALSRFSELLDSESGMPVVRDNGSTQHRWLVDRARELLRTSEDTEPHSVPWLAQNLGVSERTFYYAFQNSLGVSPHRYFMIRKLNRIRRVLLDAGPRPGVITRAAMDSGFEDLSRMGQMYRKHFGETPRETMRSTAHA